MVRLFVGGTLLLAAVTLYALFHCLTRDSSQIAVLPKWAWALIVVCVPVIGVLLWFLIGYKSTKLHSNRGIHPTGPEDDPEFIRKINDDIAERKRHRTRGSSEDGETSTS